MDAIFQAVRLQNKGFEVIPPAELKALIAIIDAQRPPSLREISRRMRLAQGSCSRVAYLVRRLEGKGLVRREHKACRTLKSNYRYEAMA